MTPAGDRRPIARGDLVRIALAPLHVIIGASLVVRFVAGARTPMVLVLGLAFMAFGAHRLYLVRRGLRARRAALGGERAP